MTRGQRPGRTDRTDRTGRAGIDVELDLRAPDAGEASAYRAVPAAGRGKGVLVIGESAALDEFVRDACDRLARGGFAVLAPDLGSDAGSERRIEAAVRQLLDDDATDGPRVGALAFGEGARRLLACAHSLTRVAGLVDCGGLPDEDGEEFPAVPTLLIFGAEDERVEEARRLAGRLSGARLQLLPGAGAGFMDPIRADRHVAAAAASAWDAILAFFEASL